MQITESKEQMANTNILIAIPTHTGQIEYKCVLSLLELRENLIAAGIRYEIQFVAGSSLIPNVRNYFGHRVAFESGQERKRIHPSVVQPAHISEAEWRVAGSGQRAIARRTIERSVIGSGRRA